MITHQLSAEKSRILASKSEPNAKGAPGKTGKMEPATPTNMAPAKIILTIMSSIQ